MATDKLAKVTEITALSITPEALAGVREAIAEIGADDISVFNLTRVKVPSSGATTWEVPSLEPTKTLDAVIIAAQTARQYYEKAAGDEGTVSGTPPDCASADGVTGHGSPGGACATCPLAAFGGGCKKRKHCLLLIEGSILPVFLNLPPGSLGNLRDYQLQELVGRQGGKRLVQVVTRIGLEATKNPQGQPYSKATFALIEVLDSARAAVAEQYAGAMVGLLTSLAFAAEDAPVPVSTLNVDDYVTAQSGGTDADPDA